MASEPDVASAREERYNIELSDFPEPLTAEIVVSAPDHLPPELKDIAQTVYHDTSSFPASGSAPSIARVIMVIDFPIPFPAATPIPSPSTEEAAPDTEDAEVEKAAPSLTEPERPVDTAVLVFPPSSLEGGSSTAAVHALVTGEGSMSAPKGKCTSTSLYTSVILPSEN